MVGRWQGSATRSLVMHADPLAAYAYRWLGGIASIDDHRPLVRLVLEPFARARPACSTRSFAPTASSPSGFATAESAARETVPMGVEPGCSRRRCARRELRAAALASLGLDPDAHLLLVGVGRFSAEKRWDMVIRAVSECSVGTAGRLAPRRRRSQRGAGSSGWPGASPTSR